MEQGGASSVLADKRYLAGEPLVSYETIINFINSTRTKTGLKVKANWIRMNMKRQEDNRRTDAHCESQTP